jgi:hypothetical protein
VLECLLVEGTLDHDDIQSEGALCLQYSAAVCQQLLMCVKCLEEQTRGVDLLAGVLSDSSFLACTGSVSGCGLRASLK